MTSGKKARDRIPSDRPGRFQRTRIAAIRPRTALTRVGVVSACVFVALTASAWAANPIATPPANCAAMTSPYDYTQAAAGACFVTDPLLRVAALPDGGKQYVYREASGNLVSEPVPPAGVNLATLSAAQLEEYGLAPQPATLPALADWTQEMSREQFATPPPFLAEIPPAQQGSPPAASLETSSRPGDSCSGNICTLYGTFAGWSTSDYIGQTTVITHVSDVYHEPKLYGTSCSTPGLSTWSGIGNTDTIFGQDGTDTFSGGVQHTEFWQTYDAKSSPNYHNTGYLSVVPAGHTVRANVNYDNGTLSGSVTDVTTGRVRGWSDSGLTGTAPNTGAGIVENVPGFDLANFGNSPGLTFQSSTADGLALNDQPSYDGNPALLNQYEIQNGSAVANTSAITGNGAFTVAQEHC